MEGGKEGSKEGRKKGGREGQREKGRERGKRGREEEKEGGREGGRERGKEGREGERKRKREGGREGGRKKETDRQTDREREREREREGERERERERHTQSPPPIPTSSYDCDEFTKQFYRTHYNIQDFSPLAIQNPPAPQPPRTLPPHNGFGSPEDSLQSCLSLVPQPPRKDVLKMLENDGKVLRYAAVLVCILNTRI